jgi:hypothetical protein
MHWSVPLQLDWSPPPAMRLDELAAIAQRIQAVQNQTILWLSTGLGGDLVEDMLNELGINPHDYWAALERSIDDLAREDAQISGLEECTVDGSGLRPKHCV